MKTPANLYLIIAFLIIGWGGCSQYLSRKYRDAAQNLVNVNSQLKYSQDRAGRQTAQNSILILENRELKSIARDFKNKYEMERLKPARVRYIHSLDIVTKDSISVKTLVEYKDSFPVYISQDSSQWHNIYVRAGVDSTKVTYSINNKLITWHQNSAPWYKKSNYQVYTINLNPNTTTKESQTYSLKEKRKYRGVWLGIGFLAGILLQ